MKNHPFLISDTASRSRNSKLYSQAFAAFGSTGSQYCATTAGFGANQEAVGAFAFGNGRLISAFHDVS